MKTVELSPGYVQVNTHFPFNKTAAFPPLLKKI